MSLHNPNPRFERREQPLFCSYEACRAKLPVFDCIYHCHPEVELIAINGSHGTCLIDGQLERFKPGDVFLIGSMAPHSFTNRRRDSTGKDWTDYTVLQLKPDLLGDQIGVCRELNALRLLLKRKKSMVLQGDLMPQAHKLLSKIPDLPTSLGLIRILEILDLITRHESLTRELSGQKFNQNLKDQDYERLARVHRYVHEHCMDAPKLVDVAKCAGMTPPSFSRYFRQKTGSTWQDYLVEIRVLEACSQLALSHESITNICYGSGFNNLSNFNRHFKRLKGCTPSEFRESWVNLKNKESPFTQSAEILHNSPHFLSTRLS